MMTNFDQQKYDQTIDYFNTQYDETKIHHHIGDEHKFSQYADLDSTLTNTLKQPIQILYFDEDVLRSFQANCFAKGSLSGNLDWNYNNRFESFFPKSAVTLENNKIKLSDIKRIYNINDTTEGVTIVFFWTNFMRKNVMKAFDQINDNIKSFASDTAINLITINTDYSFMVSE